VRSFLKAGDPPPDLINDEAVWKLIEAAIALIWQSADHERSQRRQPKRPLGRLSRRLRGGCRSPADPARAYAKSAAGRVPVMSSRATQSVATHGKQKRRRDNGLWLRLPAYCSYKGDTVRLARLRFGGPSRVASTKASVRDGRCRSSRSPSIVPSRTDEAGSISSARVRCDLFAEHHRPSKRAA
jgi:hypothetical protein